MRLSKSTSFQAPKAGQGIHESLSKSTQFHVAATVAHTSAVTGPPTKATSFHVVTSDAPAGSAVPNGSNPFTQAPPALQARAQQAYRLDCASCHNDNGNGKGDLAKAMGLSVPDLTRAGVLADKPDAELYSAIQNGRGRMPGEEGRIKDDVIWNLVLICRSMPSRAAAVPAKVAVAKPPVVAQPAPPASSTAQPAAATQAKP